MANEQRLIDANALDTVPWEDQWDAMKAINNAPTVDAIPMPCKMGDEVWGLRKNRYSLRPEKGIVHHMYFGDDMRLCICVKNVCRGEWGKNVFATYEEAEEALAKMDGGNEDG
jgi:hypothetical protein